MGNGSPSVILHADNAITERTGFEGVPVVRPSLIVIMNDHSEDARKWASELAEGVRDALLSVHERVKAVTLCSHDSQSIPNCPVCSEPDRQKLLVLVAKGTQPFPAIPALDWWLEEGKNRAILPVFQQTKEKLTAFDRDELTRVNVKFWFNSIREAIPAVLAAVGLTSDSRRIFISYRRAESEPLAEHLFEALNRNSFQVFLDRFVVPPGVDFQRRLDEELANKSMVLLLESEKFGTSRWTQHEIDHCKRFRLGLLAFQMPFGLDGAKVPKLSAVDDAIRIKLANTAFADPQAKRVTQNGEEFLQWGRLQESELAPLIERILAEHDRAMMQRRLYIRDQMLKALQDAGGGTAQVRADGMMIAGGGKGKQYALWLTTRPPELPDFHVTHTSSRIPVKSKGVVIGPLALLESGTNERLQWLSGVCEFVCVDEGQIVAVADEIVKGDL